MKLTRKIIIKFSYRPVAVRRRLGNLPRHARRSRDDGRVRPLIIPQLDASANFEEPFCSVASGTGVQGHPSPSIPHPHVSNRSP